jgi:hypothetical protein
MVREDRSEDRTEARAATGDSCAYPVDTPTPETMKELPARWAGTWERGCRDAG